MATTLTSQPNNADRETVQRDGVGVLLGAIIGVSQSGCFAMGSRIGEILLAESYLVWLYNFIILVQEIELITCFEFID